MKTFRTLSSLATLGLAASLLCGQAHAAECTAMPQPRPGPNPISASEKLTFDIDVAGVNGATLTLETLKGKGGEGTLQTQLRVKTNTFFNKVRKVDSILSGTLRGSDLRTTALREEVSVGDKKRTTTVAFPATAQAGKLEISTVQPKGKPIVRKLDTGGALDYAGALALLRSMPLATGQEFCFEVYSLRRLWMVRGRVQSLEQVSVPAGEYRAWHIVGTATRLGAGEKMEKDVHLWLSDDELRLPLAISGSIDLGTVRARLKRVARPDFKAEPAQPASLEW